MAAELELALYRVRRDAVLAPAGWRPIFEHLATRLFDPELRLKPLRRAHGLAHPEATREIEAAFGCEPGEYVTRRRIETVKTLLRFEALTVWQCGQRVGFTSPSGFEAAYRRVCDETPTVTREKLVAAGAMVAAEWAAAGTADLRRLLALQEPPAAIAESCRVLRERSRAALRERADSVESWERGLAEEWWEQAQALPAAVLWPLLPGPLETPAAFEMLCRASRGEGRLDRQRGLELAEVALESLVLLPGRLEPDRVAEVEAKGLIEVGNAHRLAHAFPAAEQAFAAAERRLKSSLGAPVELHVDFLRLKASLYHDEQRFEEALVLSHRALPLAEGQPLSQAKILLRQGSIHFHLGCTKEGLADFKMAFELLSWQSEPFLA